jgi:hypothetical protein
MKKIIFPIFLILIFSCQNNENSTETVNTSIDTNVDSSVVVQSKMKEFLLDTTFFAKKVHLSKALSKKEIEKLQIMDLIPGMEDYRNTAKLIDTLIVTNEATVLLVACDEENEHFIWTLVYDKSGNLSDSKLLFYEDFVEYFSRTYSEIKNNEIKIVTETENDEASSSETEKFILNGTKFQKVK